MRYEDDFGSFWMVDDNEFVKRRHLSRGRPRKYETSPTSPDEGDLESIDQIQIQCSNSSQAMSSDKLAAESNIGAAMNYGSPSNSSSSISTNFGNEGDVLKSGNNNNNVAQ